MIKAIFFDFDGTISDAHKIVHDGMIWLFENEGYKVNRKKLKRLLGEKMEKIVEKMGFKGNVNVLREKFYKEVNRKLDNTKLKLCVSIKPLENLKKKYILLVVSNNETQFIKKSAKKLHVDNLFKEIHGAEGSKTKDILIKKLFKKYNFKPKQVIYVGDRFSDIKYARKADCWAVAIHNKYSWSSKKLILKEHPDFIIKDFEGLKKVIDKIDKN